MCARVILEMSLAVEMILDEWAFWWCKQPHICPLTLDFACCMFP